MGTLTSTIGLSSPDSLPFVLSTTTTNISNVGNFSEVGVLKLTNDYNFFVSHSALLGYNSIGPNGAWAFVQNPTTNAYKIKLYGLQQFEEGMTFDGAQPFATLKPGDSTLVSLSPQQTNILAVSAFGDSTLNYYIADRGGEFGKSVLILDNTSTNWNYIIADAELGETLPVTNTDNASYDLGIAVGDWDLLSTWIINNKGYVLKFDDGGGGNFKYIFINSRGKSTVFDFGATIEEYSIDDLGLILLDDTNNVDVLIKYFTGDNFYEHAFTGSAGDISGDWGNTTADGSFILAVYDYNDNEGDEATILINKDKSYVLQVLNASGTGRYIDSAVVYMYSNFVFLTVYNENTSTYEKIQIWNTSGKLLYDINVTDYDFNNINYWMYGTNKLQIILRNNNSINNNDYLLNYNGTTNKLIGFNAYNYSLDPAIGLTWTHARGTDYASRLVYAYDKYPTNSIRPWNYTWNSGLYDAESVAILYANNYNQNSSKHINSVVDFCDIVYVLDGQTDYSTYTFADDETKYIRIPGDGGGDFRITPSSDLIAFTYSTISNSSGSLNTLALTPSGVITASLIPSLQSINSGSTDIYVKPVGDYIMYNWYNPNTDITTYAMVKGGVKDTVNVEGDSRYDGVWRMRVNSLLLRSWNYPSTRNWYFNTATNKFVELTNGGASFSATAPYYPQHYFNKSVTTNGLNDGNILLGPDDGFDIGYSYPGGGLNNNMRLLKKGVVTANTTLPTTDGGWYLFLGSEAVFFVYADQNDGYAFKVRVYDLNLTLKHTIDLNTTSLTNVQVVGKRLFIQDNHDTIIFHLISLKDAVKFNKDDFSGITINDKYWWDFVA